MNTLALPAKVETAVKPKPTVGQTLYRLFVGCGFRGENEPKLQPVRVISVGRKYFTVGEDYTKEYLRSKHHLSDYREENDGFSGQYRFYASEQEFADERIRFALVTSIRAVAGNLSYRTAISIETLRQINALLKP